MADSHYDLEPYKDIPDIWVMDADFNKIDIIDDYTSLIWARRYHETGDFELYCHATEKNLSLMKLGNYVSRSDYPDEVYRIEKVEIETDPEEGSFVTASGRDMRCVIYQRCTQFSWSYYSSSQLQNIETLCRQIIYENFINTSSWSRIENPDGDTAGEDRSIYNNPDRKMDILQNGASAGLSAGTNSITVDMTNIGEWMEDMAETYDFGWRVRFTRSDSGSVMLYFELYRGTDRSAEICFADKFENIRDTTYTYDRTEYFNVVRIADKENNINISMGNSTGIDRFEDIPVEATGEKGLLVGTTDGITWENLVEMYGWAWNGGKLNYTYSSDTTGWGLFNQTYRTLHNITVWFEGYDFPLYDDAVFEKRVKTEYPNGYTIVRNGITYWHTDDKILFLKSPDGKSTWVDIISGNVTPNGFSASVEGHWGAYPDFPVVSPTKPLYNEDTGDFDYSQTDPHQKWSPWFMLYLPDIVKAAMIEDNARAQTDVYVKDEKFEGNLETQTLYRYREDYDIGDVVRVITDTGIDTDVRITEAVETFDSDGYNIEVGFEK